MKTSGLAIHKHHSVLIEFCHDYNERVKDIKQKPIEEQEIRLRLFKLLSEEAIAEVPVRLVKACVELEKAYVEWDKACSGREEVYAEWEKAYDERVKADIALEKADAERVKADIALEKADAEWVKACFEWTSLDRETWHKKWCGCKEWENGIINFAKKE